MKKNNQNRLNSLIRLLLIAMIGITIYIPVTHADIFQPAYLQLKQIDAEHYDVTWRVPAVDEKTTLKVKAQFPEGVQEVSPHRSVYISGALVDRWRVKIPDSLEDRTIRFWGLTQTGSDVLVRIENLNGREQLERVQPIHPNVTIKTELSRFNVVRTYTILGFQHILEGFDHLLFVLALMMVVKGGRRLLATVTAFTVAHSITLALASLDFLRLPSLPVEATIALSILFIATEIIHQLEGREMLTSKKPWVVAFSFGLLHGLGFASVLGEIGLPQDEIPLSLLFFNVGVEIGQVLFIAVVLLLIYCTKYFINVLVIRTERADHSSPLWERYAIKITAYWVGIIASYWMFERIFLFWA